MNFNLPFSDENKIDILSRRSVCIWNSKPYISFSAMKLLKSAIYKDKKSGIEDRETKGRERARMVPVSNWEESGGIGRFYIGKLVVVEEKANEFVDRESADDLHPHPSSSDSIWGNNSALAK